MKQKMLALVGGGRDNAVLAYTDGLRDAWGHAGVDHRLGPEPDVFGLWVWEGLLVTPGPSPIWCGEWRLATPMELTTFQVTAAELSPRVLVDHQWILEGRLDRSRE